jgi:hypothetical protein
MMLRYLLLTLVMVPSNGLAQAHHNKNPAPQPAVAPSKQRKGGGAPLQPGLPGNDRRSKGGDRDRGRDVPDKQPRSGRSDPDRGVLAESHRRSEDDRNFEGRGKHARDLAKADQIGLERGRQSRGEGWAEEPVLEHGGGRVVVDRRQFVSNSRWTGKRYSEGTERDVRLDVIELAGNSFGGVLSQRTNGGGWDKMEVEGEVEGNSIAFHTTRMLEGKKRHLKFDGYFSGNQIKTDVSGRTWSGSEASGSMILWRR